MPLLEGPGQCRGGEGDRSLPGSTKGRQAVGFESVGAVLGGHSPRRLSARTGPLFITSRARDIARRVEIPRLHALGAAVPAGLLRSA